MQRSNMSTLNTHRHNTKEEANKNEMREKNEKEPFLHLVFCLSSHQN